jgi:hypothetical protein
MAHYSYYRTFLSLKGCGNTCNQELISFCEQYYEPVINFAEFNDENPHPITDIRKSGKVSALKKMDWQGITIQAMNAISRPRSVKEISEEIARYYKSLPMSTICSQVNQSLAAALREGCIGTIPKVKQKYFLK